MEPNRREFMTVSGAALAAPLLAEETNVLGIKRSAVSAQLNMTEHDPAVEEWADYWAGLKVDAVLVSVTGILAFYPTQVPFHRRGKFLNGRDFFGECCAAAKKRGLRVVARMSPDLNWKDALDAHPEWFQRDAEGNPRTTSDDPRLYQTCMFTTYFTDYIPAIMREVNTRYPIDGIFTNAWPPFGQLPDCHCDQCKRLPAARTPAYWDRFNERTLYLWKLYDGIAKEKSPKNLFFGNMGGPIHASPNLHRLASVCQWYNCDNRGRGGGTSPIWDCALQGKTAYAVMKGRTVTNVTGSWCAGSPRWRNNRSPKRGCGSTRPSPGGMVPWYHTIGAKTASEPAAAGRNLGTISITGVRITTSTLSTGARSPTSASSWASAPSCFTKRRPTPDIWTTCKVSITLWSQLSSKKWAAAGSSIFPATFAAPPGSPATRTSAASCRTASAGCSEGKRPCISMAKAL
ncbi:MAG: hypothetical protein ACRD4O_18715 [Bryobacteraceae bacterium]